MPNALTPYERPHLPRRARFAGSRGGLRQAQCLGMVNFTELASVSSDHPVPFTDQLRLAVAAYLARSAPPRAHRIRSARLPYMVRCAGLDSLAARRPHLELYIRWMQEIRRFKPSTVSRRFSVAAGFYKTCAIDGILENSPAEYVRRPAVPPITTLGSRTCSSKPSSPRPGSPRIPATSRWWPCWGCLACGSSRPPARHPRLGEEPGTGSCLCEKGTKVVPLPLPPAVGHHRPGDRPGDRRRTTGPILLNSRSARMDRHAATRRLRRLAETAGIRAMRRIRTCSAISSSEPGPARGLICVTCRSPPATQTRAPRCFLTGLTRTSTAIRTTSWLPTWPRVPREPTSPAAQAPGGARHCR